MSNKGPIEEISVSLEVTETGLKAGAKSRLIAAVDRLGGGLLDWVGLRVEAANDRFQDTTEVQRRLMELSAGHVIEKAKVDPAFAVRALETAHRTALRGQANRDAVVVAALEDLRNSPPEEAPEAAEQPLSEPFLGRFERYAAEASTEDLRERWGRILASEIRKPGTFSQKALRVVDELEPETAKLFESICKHRLRDCLPLALVGALSFDDIIKLMTAELIIDPGSGDQGRIFQKEDFVDGGQCWFLHFDGFGIGLGLANDPQLRQPDDEPAIRMSADVPGIPVYLLTREGRAIASILQYYEEENTKKLARLIRLQWPADSNVSLYKMENELLFKLIMSF